MSTRSEDAVIIVDDSLTVRMDLAEAFSAAGFRPIPCATVAEARAEMGGGPPAAVVLDVILPDGDGCLLLTELRANPGWSSIPVLMLSNEAEVKDRVRGLQVGADEYVGKPYEVGYVVARARELVRQRRPEPASGPGAILVIDDSATFREELRRTLAAAGHPVECAASGEDGLRLAGLRRPAAVLVDGALPGIDGPTVIRRLRLDATLRSVPCVLLTASEEGGAELLALEAGADAFVRKDEPTEVILARLMAVLRNAGAIVPAEAASSLSPKRILAVDDSATYLHAVSSSLHGEGYDVILARCGEEAIELLGIQPVDCILLDLQMPGIGGQEACRRIKAAPVVRDIPLLMLTAVEDHATMIDSLGAGADDYISKASDFGVLKARVRAQIRRRQFEDENRRIRAELMRKEREALESRAARELAEARAVLVAELERKNQELEAFSYSVSHDLRAPLRAIDGFSRVLEDEYADRLDDKARHYIQRVRAGTRHMAALIDDLLKLSRIGRQAMLRERVDLGAIARLIAASLGERDPSRRVQFDIADDLVAQGDASLLTIVLENLLGNAWKFTAKRSPGRVSFTREDRDGAAVFVVRDDGAGFDMAFAGKLFAPFQRLHQAKDFEGTGVGLATVQRIVARHGGSIRAESAVGAGAAFFFTLGDGS
jgi:DNA-binding response OmpR family regulator